MIVINASDTVLLDQLNHMESFADHVKPMVVLYNYDDVSQVTAEITQKYKTLETLAVKSGSFIILQKGDLNNSAPNDSKDCIGCKIYLGENRYLGECINCIRFTKGRTDNYRKA